MEFCVISIHLFEYILESTCCVLFSQLNQQTLESDPGAI